MFPAQWTLLAKTFTTRRSARISSQAIKRAIRNEFADGGLIEPAAMASRTKRVTEVMIDRLTARGREEESSRTVVKHLIECAGLKVGDDGLTQYLIFFGASEIDNEGGSHGK